jgi:hypothetical protein
MQAHVDAGVALKDFDEGQVAPRVGLLKNGAEVTDRLMRVDEQYEMELRRHRDAIVSFKTI